MDIDDDTKNAIRRKVHAFYFAKEMPTLDKTVEVTKYEENLPQLRRTKLYQILQGMNFGWEEQNRKFFLLISQTLYVGHYNTSSVGKYRSEGKHIFYFDETWINEGHTLSKFWQDRNILSSRQVVIDSWSTGIRPSSGKGCRLIITHIGRKMDFLMKAC